MLAAVDVGTNTVRLLIGEVRAGKVEPHHYFRRITRLGGNFSAQKGLAPEAVERTLFALREISFLLREGGSSQVRAVGTAILRSAVDGPAFASRVERETGIRLEIIDGEEEAQLTALGVRSALEPKPRTALVIDIGGGSTEFALWHAGTSLLHRSYPLGVVRLAEDDPGSAAQQVRIAAVLADFRAFLAGEKLWSLAADPACRLVGTAGTVTTLAALRLGMREYDWRRVNNLVLVREELRDLLASLEPMTVTERESLPGMEPGRGDLIVPGLRIVLALLDFLARDQLSVSDFGLLEGTLLKMAKIS